METKNKLKRVIPLYLLVFYGLGNILGAGIYVLIGEISAIAEYFTPFSFLVACIAVLFTTLTYAELSSRFPYSAGEALYANKAFNSKNISRIIGFIIALSATLSSATIINGFYGYVSNFISFPQELVSIVLVIILCSIAIAGIGKSVKVAALLTLVEMFGLLLIIFYGLDKIDFKSVDINLYIPPLEMTIWYSISLAAFLAFYAFIGFEDMVTIAEEVKEPSKTMPRAIVITLVVSTILYMSVALISIMAIEPSILGKSEAPLADVYKSLTGKEPIILSLIGMFAIVNGALIQIIMISRLLYGMGKNSWIPAIFAKVNEHTRTPIFSTVFASSTILIFALWLPIITLASLTSFLIFVIFTFMNVALIKIKLNQGRMEGVISYPIYIPIIGIIINLTLLVIQISSIT